MRGCVMRYKEMERKVKNGDIPSLNRDRTEILCAKTAKGGLMSMSWFLKGVTDRIITCQPTPGGELCRRLKECINGDVNRRRVLVQEDGGFPVTSSLRRTDPFKPHGCRFGDDQCMVEDNKDCAKSSVVYEITCTTCNETVDVTTDRQPGGQGAPNYIGMTRTSVHQRMISHARGQQGRKESNPLWRHDRESHNGDQQTYKTRILHAEMNLLPLCISEALYIEKQRIGSSLNEMNENGRGELFA